MGNFDNIGTLLAAIITLLSIIGGSVGYFGKSRGDAIIKYQADAIALRDGTVSILEKENAALKSENRLLTDQNKKLSDLAQGNPQLKSLTKAIETLTKIIDDKMKAKP